MSVKKIWEFTEITSVTPINGSDVVPIGDVSASKTYKSTITNIYNYILNLLNGVFAPIAKGVTNGDSHDHSGGDGAQIDHTTCSNIGTNSHLTIDTFISSKAGSFGLASLDGSSLVIQNPANATSIATANKIPIADTSAKLDTWITTASSSSPGKVQLATSSEAVTGTDTSKAMTPATNYQVALSRIRDTMGKFSGIIPPSLNLFCGNSTSDTAPTGTFTRSTTGTRLGQAGLIETAAAGSVRREWGVGGALYGWRIEESRTNLITYSEQLDNASWGKYKATISANDGMAPDGNMTADKIIESSDSSTHVVYKTVATTLSSAHTFCVFVKKSERSRFMLYMFNNGSQSNYIRGNFDLEAQTFSISAFGNGSATQANLSDIGDGWYLASITGAPDTSTGSGTAYVQMRLLDANGNENYLGDGTSGLYAWGAQLEVGPFPTSYISTTSSAVARSADVWTVPLATSWFKSAAGALFIAGDAAPGLPSSGASQVLAMLDDGTSSNRIYIYRASTGIVYCAVSISGATAANIAIGTIENSMSFKLALSWSSSFVHISLNVASVVGSSLTLSISPTTLRLGLSISGASQWGGHIRHFAYFPAALSDAQLQAITL